MSVGYSGTLELINSSNSLTTKINSTGNSYFNAGNVGIGTTSPSAKLHIASTNAAITDPLSVGNALRFTDNDPTQNQGQVTGTIEWETKDSNNAGVQSYITTISSNTGSGNLSFGTGAGGSATEAMRIDSAGNVGIGTTNPGTKFHVKNSVSLPAAGSEGGTAKFGSSGYGLVIGAASNGKGYIQSQRSDGTATTYDLMVQPNGGNVGIGTASPSTELQVSGTISSVSNIENGTAQISILNSNTATNDEQFFVGNNLADVDLGNKRGALKIFAGTTEAMRITSSGEIQATNQIKSPLYYSYSGSFTSSNGNWVNVHLLEQSEFRNRTITASAYVVGTHSYASATINVMHNGGSYVEVIGNKLLSSGADLRVSGGYLQFYVTPWSAHSAYRLTVN